MRMLPQRYSARAKLTSFPRAVLLACGAAVVTLLLFACSTNEPTSPVLRSISGPVVLRGYFVAADGRFNGTRVVGDADGVKVELVRGNQVIATTTTVDGTYRFSGLGTGTYNVRTVTVGAVHDTTEALTVAVADVVVADTLRLNSQGDLYPVPNPFADFTRVYFEIADSLSPHITIRSLAGSQVRLLSPGARPAGLWSVVWDGRDDAGALVSAPIHWIVYEWGADRRAQLLFR